MTNRHHGANVAAMDTPAQPSIPYDDLLFGVRRSIRYHRRRQGFFDRCHILTMAVVVLFGLATITAFASALIEGWPLWAKLAPSVLATVLGTFDLLIGFSRKSCIYADLARQFGELEQRMEQANAGASGELDAEALADLTSRRLAIENAEPPALQVLDTLCHNDLLRAMGYPRNEWIEVGFWQRRFAQFFDISPHKLAP